MPKPYYLFWAMLVGWGAIMLVASGKGYIFTGLWS